MMWGFSLGTVYLLLFGRSLMALREFWKFLMVLVAVTRDRVNCFRGKEARMDNERIAEYSQFW